MYSGPTPPPPQKKLSFSVTSPHPDGGQPCGGCGGCGCGGAQGGRGAQQPVL
jgi:hypothetical protein